MTEEADDDDLRRQRASSYALAAIKRETASVSDLVHERLPTSARASRVLTKHLRKVAQLLDYLQEDPQLLDPLLKDLMSPLTKTFLAISSAETNTVPTLAALRGLAEVLYTLCKVRGAKVIVRFLDNEARYIQPMLKTLERSIEDDVVDPNTTDQMVGENSIPITPQPARGHWQLRYILQLWVGHLMLTPFDLSTISSKDVVSSLHREFGLPRDLPSIANRVVRICYRYLSAPTKEQASAATALVILALRPDMRRLGMLSSLVKHALSALAPAGDRDLDVYAANGYLLFLHGLLRSANFDDVSKYFEAIFERINDILRGTSTGYVILTDSATTKKLMIKINRNLTVHLLQMTPRNSAETRMVVERMLNVNRSLEEVVDSLLSSLGDRETPVRYAASKALSIITSKMTTDLAEQVVGAVVDGLVEDVREVDDDSGKRRDVSSVNAARWHGLTLTLAHMLFRRSPTPEQLPGVLSALFLSLTFEQRASTGNSLGVNVRDAANFGLWSLARRYSTEQLAAVDKAVTKANSLISTLQKVATDLIVAACMDPAGNVRRGSSAALQELIGRHPYTIQEGIGVVQIVDYHAVGLRRRAMIEVAYAAANLGPSYLEGLWDGLIGWRGLQAPDTASRTFAATSLGQLSTLMPAGKVRDHVDAFQHLLNHLPRREVEWRHGLIMSLAAIIRESLETNSQEAAWYWNLFKQALVIDTGELTKASMRSEMTTSATVELIAAICTLALNEYTRDHDRAHAGESRITFNTLTVCLKTSDSTTLEVIPDACIRLSLLLRDRERYELAESWFSGFAATSMTPRRAGYMTALAALAYSVQLLQSGESIAESKDIEEKVMTVLLTTFNSTEDIDARVMSLRCLALALRGPLGDLRERSQRPAIEGHGNKLSRVILTGLNDYTINERGDVGSLVRIEAMATLAMLTPAAQSIWSECFLAVHRLALERLDKVRLQAAHTLQALDRSTKAENEVSTYEYFHIAILNILTAPSKYYSASNQDWENTNYLEAFLVGISSSTGQGAESLMQTARSALWTVLDSLPTYPTPTTPISLHSVAQHLLTVLSNATPPSNDRTLLPLLETLAFLFDTGILDRLASPVAAASNEHAKPFKFLTLLSLVQKAHFKSTSLPKLLVCVQIYRGLASLPVSSSSLPGHSRLKAETLKKLASMLLHPFPKVRLAVAEVLWVVLGEGSPSRGSEGEGEDVEARQKAKGVAEALRDVDWSSGGVEAEGKRKRMVGVLRGTLGV